MSLLPHRLDEKTGKLNTSKACFKLDTVGKLGSICLAIFSGLGLVSYKETKAEDGSIDVEVRDAQHSMHCTGHDTGFFAGVCIK